MAKNSASIKSKGFARRLGTCVLLLFASGVIGFSLCAFRGEEAAVLQIPKEALDFGEVWGQRRFPWTLPIENLSAKAVHVSRLWSSCGCTVNDPKSFTIPPGEAVRVQLALDLLSRQPAEPGAVRRISVELVALTLDKISPAPRWRLHGRIRRHPLTVSQRTVDFGDDLVEGFPFRHEQVLVKPSLPLERLTARAKSSAVEVVAEPCGGERGAFAVKIVPRPGLTAGTYDLVVTLHAETASAKVGPIPPLPIPVSIRVRRDVFAFPARLMLGLGELGSVLEQTVVLRSTHCPFTVEEARGDADGVLVVQALPTANRGGRVFRISQAVVAIGPQQNAARFVIKQACYDGAYEVTVPVQYEGMEEKQR